MKKVFFVFGFIYVSNVTKAKRPYISLLTYDNYNDAFEAMQKHQSSLRRDGFKVLNGKVYCKTIEL